MDGMPMNEMVRVFGVDEEIIQRVLVLKCGHRAGPHYYTRWLAKETGKSLWDIEFMDERIQIRIALGLSLAYTKS
jgi:hypothetical protein